MDTFYQLIKNIKKLAVTVIFISIYGCSSSGSINLVMEHDVITYSQNGQAKLIKKDEKYSWDGKETLLLEAPGRSSTLLISPNSKNTTKIFLPKKEEVEALSKGALENVQPEKTQGNSGNKTNSTDGFSNEVFGKLVDRIQEVNILLKNSKFDTAITLIDSMRSEFPQLKYLNFLKASALLLKNDLQGAKVLLEDALQEMPDHKNGKLLLEIVNSRLKKGG